MTRSMQLYTEMELDELRELTYEDFDAAAPEVVAYRIWAATGRNVSKTKAFLDQMYDVGYIHFTPPTTATLSKWKKSFRWDARARDEFRTVMPQQFADTVMTLTQNALNAAEVLIEVMNDKSQPARDRVKAAEGVLDRVGVIPFRMNTQEQRNEPQEQYETLSAAMMDPELLKQQLMKKLQDAGSWSMKQMDDADEAEYRHYLADVIETSASEEQEHTND